MCGDLVRREHGVTLAVRDHCDEAAIDDDVDRDAECVVHRAEEGVGVSRLGELVADPSRAHDPGVTHIGHVVYEHRLAPELAGQIDATQPRTRVPTGGGWQSRCHVVDRDPEARRTHEVPVRAVTAVGRSNRPALARELVHAHAQLFGGAGDQRTPRVRARLADRRRALLDRAAAHGDQLVRRRPGRRTLDVDDRRIDTELVGRDGYESGPDPLTELGLARAHDDAAVTQRQPLVEVGVARKAPEPRAVNHRAPPAPRRPRRGCARASRSGTGAGRGHARHRLESATGSPRRAP